MADSFEFTSVPVKTAEQSQQPLPEQIQSQREYLKKGPQRDLLRDVGRIAARTGEAIAGIPGNIPSFVLGLGSYLTGGEIPTYEKAQETIPFLPPTSEQIREKVTKPLTKEYLEPQTPQEQFFDTVIGDISSVLLPGGQAKTLGGFLKGALGLTGRSIAGTVAQKGISELGFDDPLSQGLTKFLVMTGPVIPGTRKSLENTMNKDYAIAKKQLPGEIIINPKNMRQQIARIKNDIKKRDFEGKDIASLRIKEAENLLKSNILKIEDIWQRKKDLNEMIFESKFPKEAQNATKAIRNVFNETLQKYGEKNPVFKEHFNRAENLFSGLNNSSKIGEWLNKNINIKALAKNPIVKIGLGQMAYSALGVKKGLITAGALGSLGVGTRELFKFKDFLSKSSEARKVYGDILKNSLKENTLAVTRDVKKLNKLADNYEQKETSGEFEFTKL